MNKVGPSFNFTSNDDRPFILPGSEWHWLGYYDSEPARGQSWPAKFIYPL